MVRKSVRVKRRRARTGALTKYIIPVRDMSIAIADLDSMGINYSRIYPGFEGIARTAEIRVLMRQKEL